MRIENLNQQVSEVGRLYPQVYHRFHVSRQMLPGLDVTPRMLSLLKHLATTGPLTLGELVDHTNLSKATLTELADRLESRNLVSRMRDERDKRRVFIWLTESGTQVAESYSDVLENKKLMSSMARMSADDRDKLIDGLRALIAASEGEKDHE